MHRYTKMKENQEKPPEYDNLFGKNLKLQVEVAKIFVENMKIKNDLEMKT